MAKNYIKNSVKKKQTILATMLELVVKQGVHATPMSQLARESNVAIGTIYHHFENKEAIISEIFKMIRQDFATILIQELEGKSQEAIFKGYWKSIYHYYISHPTAFQFYEYIAKSPIIAQELMEETKDYYREHANFFWKGIKDGTLKNMHVTLLVQLAYSNIVAAVELKLKKEVTMTKEQIEQAANASWDAVRIIK